MNDITADDDAECEDTVDIVIENDEEDAVEEPVASETAAQFVTDGNPATPIAVGKAMQSHIHRTPRTPSAHTVYNDALTAAVEYSRILEGKLHQLEMLGSPANHKLQSQESTQSQNALAENTELFGAQRVITELRAEIASKDEALAVMIEHMKVRESEFAAREQVRGITFYSKRLLFHNVFNIFSGNAAGV